MPVATIVEQLRFANQWLPLLGFGHRFIAETDPARKALVIADAAEWLASKTANKLDDLLVEDITAILKTPEGEKLVRDLLVLGEAASAAASAAEGIR